MNDTLKNLIGLYKEKSTYDFKNPKVSDTLFYIENDEPEELYIEAYYGYNNEYSLAFPCIENAENECVHNLEDFMKKKSSPLFNTYDEAYDCVNELHNAIKEELKVNIKSPQDLLDFIINNSTFDKYVFETTALEMYKKFYDEAIVTEYDFTKYKIGDTFYVYDRFSNIYSVHIESKNEIGLLKIVCKIVQIVPSMKDDEHLLRTIFSFCEDSASELKETIRNNFQTEKAYTDYIPQ